MTDKLTTDERVKLAEFCGRKVEEIDGGLVFVRKTDSVSLLRDVWQPAEDANQRDEVVEALCRQDEFRTVISCRSLGNWSLCEIMETDVCVSRAEADTPGLAVGRAALKVIGNS